MKRTVLLACMILCCFVLFGAESTINNVTNTRGFGHSVFFDGAGDLSYVSLGNFGAQQTFTISMWIKPYENQRYISVILDCNHSGGENWVMQRIASDPYWGFYNNTFILQSNVWQHFAVTSQNGVLKTYINGILSNTTTHGSFNYTRTPNLSLGNWFEARKFYGLIDELHISTNVRYTSDFSPLLRETSDSNTYGLWHFDEGSGTTCADSSTPMNNGTFIDPFSGAMKIPGVTADFTANLSNGTAPLNVNFTDQSSGNVTSWQWDFENDGIVDSYLQNPSHTYSQIGHYSVKLVVGNGILEDSIVKTNYITANGIPDISISPLTLNCIVRQGYTSDQTFDITNSGTGFLDFSINETTPLNPQLSFFPSSGEVNANESTQISISVDGASLADGLYNKSVIITSNTLEPRDTIYIPVTVKVDITPPVTPTGLMFHEALSDMNQISLAWLTNALADSVYSYKIYRRGVHDTLWTLKGTVDADTPWFSDYQFTGLDTTAVYYKITAVDWVDNESPALQKFWHGCKDSLLPPV